ncbi:MAG: AarF/ABC1/UbiB kinase family protein [Rhodospirillaceae bacterium]|nr:AarF/ABC1/UbiB kinase family protein [Rhodospirillaceae bacterium]MCA8931865.1 AarF/ABC1/UbiB kinase family protein [Rhodospirillaceae bacterium]
MARDNEESTFGGRLTRYARVSRTMAGLGARMAGERYLGLTFDNEKHAESLKVALGGLKGPLMKVAQLLATIPEALPEEYAREFRQLQSNAPPMGWAFVKRRMQTELGPDWQGRFGSFEHAAGNAASLGQVHKAVAKDGTHLACKLQYPDMRSAVEADLRQLKMIFGIVERYYGSVGTKQIYKEVGDRLREELDYVLEAKHCALYCDMLSSEGTVHVPSVWPDLSTGRLLTTTWLDGRPIMEFVDAELEVRNTLAMNMFRAWYVPLYFYGVIHGDPHLGNYSVRPDYSINLLDFGCVRVFPPSFVRGVIDLYRALQTDDRDLAVHSYETWGFRDLTDEQVDVLSIWARFLYGPILDDSVRRIGSTETGVYGRETATKVQKELARVGSVEVPREFVFMDRAALGLGSVFLHLKAEVNWYRLFNELIDDFDEAALAERQQAMLAKHDVPGPGENPVAAVATPQVLPT